MLFLLLLGFSKLFAQTCLVNGIKFQTQAEIDAFSTNYPYCTQILGDVQVVKSSRITNLDGLRYIDAIKGNLVVVENRSLINLQGLSSLTFVGGNLIIAGNHLLANLEGVEHIEQVGNNLSIDDNGSLSNVNAFTNLRFVGGRLGIYNCEMLKQLHSFNQLETVGGYIDIHNNDALIQMDGFHKLKKVGGMWIINNDQLQTIYGVNRLDSIADNFDVRNEKSLTAIHGFQRLSFIGNSCIIDNNKELMDLSGLRSIRYVGQSLVVLRLGKLSNLEGLTGIRFAGGLEIRENIALQSLKGLDSLRALTGLLQLVKNQALTDLSALKNITSLKGRLEIVDNQVLETLSGLENIDYTTIDFMTITGCEQLNYCAVPSICNYLNFGRNAEIRQNATGCNSKPEVIAANPNCTPNFASKAKSVWQTEQGRWLLALVIVIIIGSFFAWYFYRRRHRSQFMELRTTLAQDLHDDFGSEVSSIALASYAAAQSGDIIRMSIALEQIAKQSEQLIEDMRDIVWSIHPDNDTLEKMVGRMKIYANQLLGEQETVIDFDVSTEILGIKLSPEARKQLYLLFKEAMNNLAKYANCNLVHVRMHRKDKQFILVISDNGRGFDLASTPMGNGIHNMHSRSASLNGTLEILTSPGNGTTIRLRAMLK